MTYAKYVYLSNKNVFRSINEVLGLAGILSLPSNVWLSQEK